MGLLWDLGSKWGLSGMEKTESSAMEWSVSNVFVMSSSNEWYLSMEWFCVLHLKQNHASDISDRRAFSPVEMSTQLAWYHTSHSSHATPGWVHCTCRSQYPHGKVSHCLGPGLTWISPANKSINKVTSLAGLSESRADWGLGTFKSLLLQHRPRDCIVCTLSAIATEIGVPWEDSAVGGLCAMLAQSFDNSQSRRIKQGRVSWRCILAQHPVRFGYSFHFLAQWQRIRQQTLSFLQITIIQAH